MQFHSLKLVALLVAGAALAQSLTITIGPADVDAQVAGGFVAELPDGGCSLTVLYAGPIGDAGVVALGKPHPFNGARCNTVQTALQKASYLDVGVGDGGAP